MTDALHDRSQTAVLILAGGEGTRLWPLSTDSRPKQFLDIFPDGSLLQQTFRRLETLVPAGQIFVSTNDRYADAIAQQLPSLLRENILVEPLRRNTGPAIAICCFEIERRLGAETTLAIFPSDSAVTAPDIFLRCARRAVDFAASREAIVTLAITPSEPNTSFGYLDLGAEVAPGVVALKNFVEKPDRARAEEFLRAGHYAWNAGIFVFRLGYFHGVVRDVAPELEALASRYVASSDDGEKREIYARMPSLSIDYGVMEKAPQVFAVPGDFGWSDVGSWRAVAKLIGSRKELRVLRSQNSFAFSESGKKIVIVGLEEIAVIESERGILVLNLRDDEGLSAFIRELES